MAAIVLVAVCGVSVAGAQDGSGVSPKAHYLGVDSVRSVLILGSDDSRSGYGISYGYGKPDRGLKCVFGKGERVSEVYLERTHSRGVNTDKANDTYALGGMVIARYWHRHTYFDAGFGIQLENKTTNDLTNNLNSTPMLGGGMVFNSGGRSYLLGFRFLHISNGGTRQPNPGQNQLVINFNLRY